MISNSINTPKQSNNNTIGAKEIKSEITSSHVILAAPDSLYKFSIDEQLKSIENKNKQLQQDIFERERKEKKVKNFKSTLFFAGAIITLATSLLGICSLKK